MSDISFFTIALRSLVLWVATCLEDLQNVRKFDDCQGNVGKLIKSLGKLFIVHLTFWTTPLFSSIVV